MLKKILFAVMLFCTVLSFAAGAEIVPEKPTLTYDKYDIDDDGVFDDMVYEISTKEELYWFANAVNNGQGHINVILMNDIVVNENLLSKLTVAEDLSAVLNDGESAAVWCCYGTYKGVFDGRGYRISGLYYNDDTETAANSGLLGNISGAIVRNVNVDDSYFSSNGMAVGGIAAKASSSTTIENCTFDGYCHVIGNAITGGIVGDASSSVISFCSNYGDVYGNGDVHYPVGGIAGRTGSSCYVNNCSNEGNVTGSTDGYIGGIVGFNYGTINYCYNKGTISGDPGSGLCVVHYRGHINNSFNVGVAKLGVGSYTTIDPENGYVSNCYWLESVSDHGYRSDPEGVSESRTEDEMKSLTFLKDLSNGTEGIWQQTEGEYPTLVPFKMQDIPVNSEATADTTSHIYSVSDKTITVAADDAGVTFTVVFSDYEGNKQNAVDIVTFSSEKAATKYSFTTDLSLASGDKVIVLVSTASLCPACKEYVIE